MKSRQVLIAITMLATLWHTAAAEPKKAKAPADAPPLESVLPDTEVESNPVLSDLTAVKPQIPLSPRDVLKSYEIAMGMVADKASADISVIVQAQQANQITRDQAEYLLQQRYQVAMMQYQVISALHDVLKHELDEASEQRTSSLKTSTSDAVLVVPPPGSVPGYR